MKESDKYLHKEFIHPELGRVRVDKVLSRVTVDIFVLQRAEGWNDATETYERFKDYSKTLRLDFKGYKYQWHTNRKCNDQYGHKDYCHIKVLTQVPG